MYEIMVLFLVAFLIAIFSASLGIGGGIFTVPVLIYVGSLHGIGQAHLAHMAVATSLLVAFVLSVSASFLNLRQKMVEIGVGLLFALGSIPGAFLGSLVGKLLPFRGITLIFGGFVLSVGLFAIFRLYRPTWRTMTKTTGKAAAPIFPAPSSPHHRILLPVTGIFAGAISSLTGVGGGVIMVPLFSLFLRGQPIYRSIATSNFSMVLVTLAGSAAYLGNEESHLPAPSIGFYYLPLTLPFLAGAVLGGLFGARIGKQVPERGLKLFLAGLQIVIGARMLWKYSGLV